MMMDSKNCKYPCTGCARDGKCTGDFCKAYKKWFSEIWQEITEVFKDEDEL
jgi:hypothetical protein